jgi:hypothetical protein
MPPPSTPLEPLLKLEGPWVCCEAWKVVHPFVCLFFLNFSFPLSPCLLYLTLSLPFSLRQPSSPRLTQDIKAKIHIKDREGKSVPLTVTIPNGKESVVCEFGECEHGFCENCIVLEFGGHGEWLEIMGGGD